VAKMGLGIKKDMNDIIKVGTKFEWYGEIYTINSFEVFRPPHGIVRVRVLIDKPTLTGWNKIYVDTLFDALDAGEVTIIND